MADTILTRAQLHALVWERPLRTAAKELGISDVGLSKICKRHGVPTPPQGHWTRVQMGKAVPKGELPLAQPGQADEIQIRGGQAHAGPRASAHPGMPPEDQVRRRELLDRETQPQASVVVRQEPSKLNAMAARVQKALKAQKPDDYGCGRCSDPALPNVRVTPDGIPR